MSLCGLLQRTRFARTFASRAVFFCDAHVVAKNDFTFFVACAANSAKLNSVFKEVTL